MLNIYELQVFLAAAETENFSAAARKLHLTQPAVSLQIQALEKRLQLELFQRTGRHITLTDAGRALVPMARELVNLSAHIEESMIARRGLVTGHLIIGCTTTPGRYILPALVGSFCHTYPDVRVTLEIIKRSDLLQKLERQDINFGIMSGQIQHPDLIYEEFIQDDLVLIVPANHPFADQEVVTPNMLRGQTIIMHAEAAGTRPTMLESLERVGLSLDDLRVTMELGSAEGVIAAVEAGCGIAWVSTVAVQRALELGRIRTVEVGGLHHQRTIYLVSHRQRARSCAHLKFYEFIDSPAGEWILHGLRVRRMEKLAA